MSASDPTAEAVPDWFVRAVTETPQIGRVALDGVGISYRVWGRSGPGTRDVLLVHGGAAHSGWWDHLAPTLAADRRVVAVDISGHGDSERRPEYSPESWADELAVVIEAAELSPHPVVIGHSLGGIVAATLARRADSELTGVVLVDSPVGLAGRAARGEAGRASFGLARTYPTKTDVVARFHPVPAQPVLDYIAAHIADQSVREVRGGWSWKFDPSFIRMGGRMPLELQALRTPAVLIAAERGILSPAAREIAAEAGVRVIEIPDAGHAIMLDQPLVLLAVLQDVLAGWQPEAAH